MSRQFNVPDMLVQGAVEQDADVIGISCQSWEYMYYVPKLMGLPRHHGMAIPVVVGGSVITAQGKGWLTDGGVKAVLGPGPTSRQVVEVLTRLAGAGGPSGEQVKLDRHS